MERPLFKAVNRRHENSTGRNVLRPYEREVARLFDEFKLDVERMFAVNCTTAARRAPGHPQRAAKKKSAA